MRLETPLALILVLSAAACATPDMVAQNKSVATSADLHEITVTQSGQRLEIPVASGGAMSAESAAMVQEFGAGYRAVGHGPLMVSTPSGGANSDAAARMAQATRMALVDSGVPFAAIAGATYDAGAAASAPVILTYNRFEAAAPTCAPVWSENLADATSNNSTALFGCAMKANLAAMISDPADLNGPRPTDPRDAARRDVVLDKYRNGEPSGATRSEDEKVVISNAVQ